MYPWMRPTYSAYGRSGAGEPSVLARVEEEPKGRDRALVGLEELGEAEASARQLGVVPATPTSSGRGPTKPSQTAMPSSTRLSLRRNPGGPACRLFADWPDGHRRHLLRDELIGVNAWKANETQTRRYWEDQG